eukprot:TRINITY_DN9593_c0_g1_i1.p1 TRINITY_DN9593_c0_g1~~TRINITY_DN9593_c0_g1_i1.p1  ORF type:complete len:484 (-),score=140.49 TRINITY_DN9593_c0_g1_i1:128-1579(-)
MLAPIRFARRAYSSGARGLFLGLDSSTQGLKATAVDAQGHIVTQASVSYDSDLPEYNTSGGALKEEEDEVTAPSLMMVSALDMLLGRLQDDKFDFGEVTAVSGSGQQHGSVYWKDGAQQQLQGLSPSAPLAEQLVDAFAIANGPIWMDSSTKLQCFVLEAALGGPQSTADLTGSRAYERFTGNQIAKRTTWPEYKSTERVSLVSSFMCSLLLGDYAPIDHSDAGGMNLMNLRSKAWDPSCLGLLGEGAEHKLGPLAPSHAVVGTIHDHFVQRYGFAAECELVAWSGDNPCSVAGLGLGSNEAAVSMGTSDTLFGLTDTPAPSTEGHLFVSPTDPKDFMAMLCYKNGSLNRERVMSRLCADWAEFETLLAKAPPGNQGNIGFFIGESEITPALPQGDRRFTAQDNSTLAFAPEHEARALIEGMAMSLRLHSGSIGVTEPTRIIATGGASANTAILQVISDVFGAPVYTAPVSYTHLTLPTKRIV